MFLQAFKETIANFLTIPKRSSSFLMASLLTAGRIYSSAFLTQLSRAKHGFLTGFYLCRRISSNWVLTLEIGMSREIFLHCSRNTLASTCIIILNPCTAETRCSTGCTLQFLDLLYYRHGDFFQDQLGGLVAMSDT